MKILVVGPLGVVDGGVLEALEDAADNVVISVDAGLCAGSNHA